MATKSSDARSSREEEARPLDTFFKMIETEARGSSISSAAEVADVIRRDRDASE